MSRPTKAHDGHGGGGTRGGRTAKRMRLYWGGVAAIAVAVVVAAGWLRSDPGSESSAGPSDEPRIAAPDFRLVLYQGADTLGAEELQFSSIFGQGKPVVLNFWAGLCPPCRAEMPDFQQVYDEFGGEFVLLGLDIGPFTGLGTREDGQRLLRELGITYPAGTTFEEITVAEYRVRGMPTTVFLTASGEIHDTHIGLMDKNTLRGKVETLLQAAGGS